MIGKERMRERGRASPHDKVVFRRERGRDEKKKKERGKMRRRRRRRRVERERKPPRDGNFRHGRERGWHSMMENSIARERERENVGILQFFGGR